MKYEISSIEPMHDIAGHIKYIFTELPSVLKGNEYIPDNNRKQTM